MVLLTLSWWPLLAPWLSPAAAWFIFYSVVVSAIAVMSASGEATSSPRRRLCRSGSSMVLDRLCSFFVFPVGQLPMDESSAASGSHCYHCCSRKAEAAAASASATPVCAPAEHRAAQQSALVVMATAEDHAPPAPPLEEEEDEVEEDHDESISLDEAYALAQRHRATKPLASPPPAAASATTAASAKETPRAGRKKQQPAKVVADWRRVSNAGDALEGKAELNARTELFIRQFREDLRLQRLNSILNHALGSPTAAR